jgi:aspartate/tyrosine/aromatic aminotransferase
MQAEKKLIEQGWNGTYQKEYAGITGIKEFCDASVKFVYGNDAAVIKDKRVGYHYCIFSLSSAFACKPVSIALCSKEILIHVFSR